MAKSVKCQRCKISDTQKEEMEFEEVGAKKQKKYYHKSCFQEHLKDKYFKEKESQELDKLVEVVKKIFGVKSIPNSAYPFLQEIRNGTRMFGKTNYQYKKGYTYDLIAETFDYCSDTIEYWLSRKSFNGFMGAFRYSLAIVSDKLQVVEQRRIDREWQQRQIELRVQKEGNTPNETFVSSFKRKDDSVDISEFLDD